MKSLAEGSKLVAAWRSRRLLRWPAEAGPSDGRFRELATGSSILGALDPTAARSSTGLRSLLAMLREGLDLAPAGRDRVSGLRLIGAVLLGVGAGGSMLAAAGQASSWIAVVSGLLLLFGAAFFALDDPGGTVEASRLAGSGPTSDRERL